MTERQVRSGGRPVYGRVQPLSRPAKRRGGGGLKISPRQWRLLGLFVGLLAAGWGMSQMFALRTITVQAPSRGGEIEVEARRIIAKKWQWQNLVTFDGAGFVSNLQQVDPLLRDVVVRRHWLNAISIKAAMKQPSLGWNTGNQAYVLDRDGTVIGQLNGAPTLPVIYDGSNVPVQVGQKAVSAHFVEFVGELGPALAASGIKVSRYDIKDTTLDLTATTDKGYKLLLDTSRGAADEVKDLAAVQRLLVSQKKTPAEYIDLRIAGKAYYK